MWASTPTPGREYTPSWSLTRFRSLRKKSASPLDPTPATSPSKSLLVPRPTVMSSDSDESRSVQSHRSRGRSSIKEMMNRLRSTSSVTLIDEPRLKESDFRHAEDWFVGFDRYNQLVTTEVSRNQTYPSEQFTKLTNLLTKSLGGRFIHGLPEAAFDFALLWCPAGAVALKDSNEPTWSWTGWEGPVNFPFDPTNSPDLRNVSRADGATFRSEIVQYHIGPQSSPYTVRRSKESRLRIHYPPYFHAPRGFDATIESDTLRFSAFTVPADGFDLEQLHYNDREIPCSQLIDEKNQHCGVIMDYQQSIASSSEARAFEFVLVSRNLQRDPASNTRRPVIPTNHPPGTPIWDGDRFVWDQEVYAFDEEVFQPGPWKLLNVILIKWVGDHAERVAVARIHEDAWLQRNPQKKDIVLR